LSLPHSKKEVLSFLGKINFLRRFVSNFVELVKHITAILSKGNEVQWTVESRYSFNQIKKALTKALVLTSPNYSKDFLIFSFASFDPVEVVLLRKNVEGLEQPISFFIRALRNVEIKYYIMEKQAHDLVKALKDFRVFVIHSKIIAYSPSTYVKDILIQPDIEGRRSKWISKILEFDLEIKPNKLVKGRGLAKILVESNCEDLGIKFISTYLENQQAELSHTYPQIIAPLAECV
jgi:hypothetical protein